MVFTKSPVTVTGHGDIVKSHEEVTSQLDYEGELAVVIGKSGTRISKEDAYVPVFVNKSLIETIKQMMKIVGSSSPAA